jgi:hypothetical protein
MTHFYRERRRGCGLRRRAGTRAIDGRSERLRRIEGLTSDATLQGQVLVGTPDAVSERLAVLQRELGIDGIPAELSCGGMIPHECVMTALRLLCEEVMPRFR